MHCYTLKGSIHTMDNFTIIILFVFGTVFGSFFNVVGIRVPKKIPFHNDRSHCPHCEHQLRFFELIPVLSYVIQGGKCRSCKAKISFMYPFVELMTGLLFAYAFIRLGLQLELIVALLLISLLMIIFVSDMYYMLIPDKVLLFFLPLFIIARIFIPLNPWYDAIIGAVVGYVLLAVIIIVSKGGMGAGDMKLFGVIGFILGWKLTLLTFFLAALFGAVVGGAFMMAKKVKKGQAIPFGPFIVLGAIVSYFHGQTLIDFYLSFL